MFKDKNKRKKRNKRYSDISDHKRKGKLLQPPMATLPNMATKSWLNDQLPEMLWAILVISTLERKEALYIFKTVAALGRKYREIEDVKAGLTLTELSKVDESLLNHIIGIVTTHPLGYAALRPLLFFKNMPAYDRWSELIDTKPQKGDWETLRVAVANTIDHQSQESTDCRWLTILFKIAAGQIIFPHNMEEKILEIVEYPNRGDMRKVRPSIRAMEMAFRNDNPKNSQWPDQFWKKCYEETPCIQNVSDSIPLNLRVYSAFKQVVDIFNSLEEHSYNTSISSSVDPKHDTAFGFCFFALAILEELCRPGNSYTILARFALRSLVEIFITFNYLIFKNNNDLWNSHRVYGAGQAKLSFLKIEEKSDDLPSFVNKETLENLANEDVHQEYLSINIGHWDKTNLRDMAENSGVKAIYDKYYSWTSSYLHAQWGSIRDSVYITCLNPLHRLHRIPRIHPRVLEDVIPDACELINRILELIDSIYPNFNDRIKIDQILKR